MKTREEAARFIEKQLGTRHICKFNKGSQCHYGLQELRELMDFIYESDKPEKEELINGRVDG